MIDSYVFEVDELAMYFGEDYKVNDYITLHQPKIYEIVKYGERQFFSLIQTVTAISSEMKSQLDDMGLDWEQITDFQLFMMLMPTLSIEKTQIIFGNINFQNMKIFEDKTSGVIVMRDPDTGVVIDELAHHKIFGYLCKAFNLTKKPERAGNDLTKKILIEEDRQKIKMNANKPYKSFFKSLISSVKARQGYTLDYIRNMGAVEFFDEVNRLQVIVNADALLQGSYSGMVDTSKIPKKNFDWTREISN